MATPDSEIKECAVGVALSFGVAEGGENLEIDVITIRWSGFECFWLQ